MASTLAPVVGFFWNDPSYPTTGICLIAVVAWNQVDVEMRHRLPCGGSVVDADVVALGIERLIKYALCPVQQRHQFKLFIWLQLKKRPDMAPWDDQRVAGRNREAISDHHAMVTAVYDPL